MASDANFKLFCKNATDRQLEGIIEKETKAAKSGDEERQRCLEIALDEQERRQVGNRGSRHD